MTSRTSSAVSTVTFDVSSWRWSVNSSASTTEAAAQNAPNAAASTRAASGAGRSSSAMASCQAGWAVWNEARSVSTARACNEASSADLDAKYV